MAALLGGLFVYVRLTLRILHANIDRWPLDVKILLTIRDPRPFFSF